jgi:hypothetical protein
MRKLRVSPKERAVLMRTTPPLLPANPPPNCLCPACIYREMIQVIWEATRDPGDELPRTPAKNEHHNQKHQQ